MSEEQIIIPTRFLVSDGQGRYVVSGFPGIALCYFAISEKEGFDEALKWYQGITQSNTSVRVLPSVSIRDLRLSVLDSLGIDPLADSPRVSGRLYLGTSHELAWIENEMLSFQEVTAAFPSNETITAFIVLVNSAGEFFRGMDDGIRYYIRSNESGHSPHIHVSYRNEKWASIYIETGEYRDGELPSRAYKTARKRICDNRSTLLKYWNAHTNGIKFEVNYLFDHKPDC